MLRRLAYRKLGNASDAEDAVQDALLMAHQKLGQFRGESSLSSWLGRIVINSALMQRRRICPLRSSFPIGEMVDELRDHTPPADEVLYTSAQWGRIAAAIEKLSPVLRETLLLRLAGQSIKEISAALKQPEGTTKASLSRAKAALRKRVGA